jgi:outer membrane receptor protein involved in Fe transport
VVSRDFGRPAIYAAVGALAAVSAQAQEAPGSIRGIVNDQDFNAPLPGVTISVIENGRKATSSDQGSYVVDRLPPGKYTLVFAKEGYVRQVRSTVVVTAGKLTDLDVSLAGEFVDMEEFVVKEALELGGSTEAGLLQLKLDSPALLDSIGADFISRAGASDAASALRLVSGATVQDGKTAVVRGLPDRYVSSQINGVRLPSADEDKRAVELDQFPSAIIESLQVSKTFTPDQQGDASGGAVNLILKSIPKDPLFFRFSSQISGNTQVMGEDRFLSYQGGGVRFFGTDDGSREIQTDAIGGNWLGAVGVTEIDAPVDHKWALSGGGRTDVGDDWTLGGFGSLFYERDSSFYDNGRDDSYWVTTPGGPMVPETSNGDPQLGGQFDTNLFDITKASQSVQWGALGTIGLEKGDHSFGLTYLFTRTTEDTATLAVDTRGKQYFHPGHDPNDPNSPGFGTGFGGNPDGSLLLEAPYLRLETLEYTERQTGSIQLSGKHKFELGRFEVLDVFRAGNMELDWTASSNFADSYQPDKRQFGTRWTPRVPGYTFEPFPGFQIPIPEQPAQHLGQPPAANINLGFLQRTWKEIEEESLQLSVNAKFPFEQWSGEKGYLKTGVFTDKVERTYDQESFTNGDTTATDPGEFYDLWSSRWPSQNHPINASDYDVDYAAEQEIFATYLMADLPLAKEVSVIGGARLEMTNVSIVNDPEPGAFYYPPVQNPSITQLTPGAADAAYERTDLLPSLALEYKPWEEVTARASYNGTIARQTFKELTPIIQQEFLGGPIFIGNPNLRTSEVDNFDLRVDYAPYAGALVSASYFKKNITDPIEYVQKVGDFTYTAPVNYPEGELDGFEFEVRQDLGHFVDELAGVSVGGNATFINSRVTLPADEAAQFSAPNIQAPLTEREMTNAPEHLFNFFITYDVPDWGTQLALFYTIQGDTLLVGAGVDPPNFVPSIYATQFDTLNFSLTQKIGDHLKLQFQAKNLTNPRIETVYRSPYIGADVLNTSRTAGVELSLTLSAEFRF